MQINRHGCTRIVVLTKTHAYKVPNFLSGWQIFLKGLLANMQERTFGTLGLAGFCPVQWSIPGGWLVVMPRARVMTDGEFYQFDAARFCDRLDYHIPAEPKSNSFGFLGADIVAIDYGS